MHSDRMWSAVCSGAPHRQAAEGLRPPAVHAGTETTYSSAEGVQGDPLSAREISSWWDVCARGDGELCRLCRLLPIMLPLLH